MSNKGWKKLMHKAHSGMFECPICDNLFKITDDYMTHSQPMQIWLVQCRKCGAQSDPSEGLKDY